MRQERRIERKTRDERIENDGDERIDNDRTQDERLERETERNERNEKITLSLGNITIGENTIKKDLRMRSQAASQRSSTVISSRCSTGSPRSLFS